MCNKLCHPNPHLILSSMAFHNFVTPTNQPNKTQLTNQSINQPNGDPYILLNLDSSKMMITMNTATTAWLLYIFCKTKWACETLERSSRVSDQRSQYLYKVNNNLCVCVCVPACVCESVCLFSFCITLIYRTV